MIAKYRLLALDMDGTLLNDEQIVTPKTVQWIQKAVDAGVHVCLSTGRSFITALPYAEQLGLETPMVTVNGSEVWRAPHELYRRSLMDPVLVKQMYDLARHYDIWFWAYSTEAVHKQANWDGETEGREWLKFGYHTEDDEIRHQLLLQLQDMGGLEITNSSPYNLEINPQGVNKAAGIKEVCQLLGINMSEVVAVGDSLNDLAVIQQAGLGVAMGNAQDTVKQEADQIVASNNEDGIAEVIQKYILNEVQASAGGLTGN
ncbi:5-amino-6-(5-phospho-D-ribitylamino)uracil phosphatase YcsE [Paenibacillus albidus]|uniref:5-amino-6-(5-phospho-D-ribitylamino)uracil phosphatase YcsE n=1 Tax=Paenibacillus albidus TaxID=2041023 RepID=A0A917F8T5_9BACL|nr:Cof-type HAD-IIB family hydrolase [Paenibacillus albidus]GGF60653.1 5-amino-6-(5-phospho-D-ribitylamino)uracil phosphatase YcsE [Paenibacillus albidus]